MRIVIPGGTGQVGGLLRRAMVARGHDVVVLSRRPERLEPGVRHVVWDSSSVGDWAAELDGADVVVNLAGRSVSCRYTDDNLRTMMAVTGRLDPRGRGRDRAGRTSAAGVVAGEHRDDLRRHPRDEPLPQAVFMRQLRWAWDTRVGLPVTAGMAGLGAWALRTDPELLLKSRRVVPGRLQDAGFVFGHPSWRRAAADLVERTRTRTEGTGLLATARAMVGG